MGLFDWLPWLPRRPRLPVTVWFDEASRLAALVDGIADDLRRNSHVIVAAHFRSSLLRVGDALAARGVPFTTRAEWSEADARVLIVDKTPRVVLLLVGALPPIAAEAPRPEAISGSRTLSFRLADLHVLVAANECVQRYTRSLPCPVRLAASTSLEDPLLVQCGGPAVKSLLQRLGFGPGKPMDSPLLTNSLWQACRKLGKRVRSDEPAESLAEWLQKNLRAP